MNLQLKGEHVRLLKRVGIAFYVDTFGILNTPDKDIRQHAKELAQATGLSESGLRTRLYALDKLTGVEIPLLRYIAKSPQQQPRVKGRANQLLSRLIYKVME